MSNAGPVLKLNDELVVRGILAGKSETVSWPHRSQYIGTGGVSACGLAALNCARVLLGLEQQDVKGDGLLLEMIKKSTFEQILEICSLWTSPSHLDVDTISESLLFSKTLDLKSVDYLSPSLDNFSRVLSDMKIRISNYSSAVIITRTPEIIACLRIVSNQGETYVVFDSHKRPNHPQGAAFIFFGSIQEAASYLADLFQVDPELLSDTSMQWEAQLFSHCSAHIFGSRRHSMLPQDWFDAVVESSITFLELKASISALQEDKRSLEGEVDRLSSDNARLDSELFERDYQHRRAQKRRDPHPPAYVAHEGQSYVSASSSRTLVAPSAPGATRASGSKERVMSDAGLAAQMRAMFEEEDRATGATGSKERVTSDAGLAAQMRAMFEEEDRATGATGSKERVTSDAGLAAQMRAIFEEEDRATGCSASGSSHSPGSANGSTVNVNDDSALAMELQRQFEQADLEDARLAAAKQREYEQEHNHLMSQLKELKSSDPGSFECGICLEEHSMFSIARVDACGHQFCRDCMQQYVKLRLGEHRFPILCPVCVAEPEKSKSGSSIPNELVQQIGLSDKDYDVFIELEMAAFSILLHCRKCEQSVFVDRREHDEVNIIACPLPNCNHVWCKNCSREVEIGGPQHSCDGTSELNHLMESQGWKHCPGCRTPVEKSQGCNHMTCMAPGCNTHFC